MNIALANWASLVVGLVCLTNLHGQVSFVGEIHARNESDSSKPASEDFGWQIGVSNNDLEFIVRPDLPSKFVISKTLTPLQRFNVPRQLQGRIHSVVVRVDGKALPRNPDLDELAQRPTRSLDVGAIASIPASVDKRSCGWVADANGAGYQLLVQVSPDKIEFMARSGREFVCEMPAFVSSRLTEVAIVVGTGELPTEPLKELPTNADVATSDHLDPVDVQKARVVELEQKMHQLANKLGQRERATDTERAELRQAVSSLFAARQNLRKAQVVDLERRAKALQQTIDAQEKMSDSIIEHKLFGLLKASGQ